MRLLARYQYAGAIRRLLICDFLDGFGIDDLNGWFRNNQNHVDPFATFGRGADGSNYALWLEPNRNPNVAPVVMLGSEGQLEVLSSSDLSLRAALDTHLEN